MERVIVINDRPVHWSYLNAHALTRRDLVIFGGSVFQVRNNEWNPRTDLVVLTLAVLDQPFNDWTPEVLQWGFEVNTPVRLVIGGRTAGMR